MDKSKLVQKLEVLMMDMSDIHTHLIKEEMAESCVATHGTNESNQSSSHSAAQQQQWENGNKGWGVTYLARCPYCDWQVAATISAMADTSASEHEQACTKHPKYKYDQLRSALGALAAECGEFLVLPEDPNSKLIESIRRGIEEGKVKINSLETGVNRQTNAKNDAINDANYVKDMIYKAAGVGSNQMHWTTALKALVNSRKVRDTVHLDLEIIRLKNVVEQKDKEIKDLREITIRDRDTLARKNNEIMDLKQQLTIANIRAKLIKINRLEQALMVIRGKAASDSTIQLIDEALLGEN